MQDNANLRDALLGLGQRNRVARELVNTFQILQFCDAIYDDNPIYRDAAAGTRAGHGGQVAPPGMLQAWTMAPLRPGTTERPLLSEARDIFRDHGYEGVVATNYDLQHERYFAVGDRVTETATIEGISELKETPIGTGFFLTSRHDFAGIDGVRAATLKGRVFHFRRRDSSNDAAPKPQARPTEHAAEPQAQEVRALPSLSVDITTTMIIAGVMACGNFEPVHIDSAYARSQGLQDIITDILSTSGLMSRFVTDWTGPNVLLNRIALALKAPNYPGDQLTLEGGASGDTVDIRGRNRRGDHVTARVQFRRN